jgi:hypothetical protein
VAIGSCESLQGFLALLSPGTSFRNALRLRFWTLIEAEYSVGISGQILQELVHRGRVKQDCSLFGRFAHAIRDELCQLCSVLVKQWVVLDDDQGVAGLFQNGHELEYRESSADLQILETSVQSAQDRGVIAGDVEDFVALKVEVAVEGFGKHLSRGYQSIEGPGAQRDGGEEIEVHTIGWWLRGLKGELGVGRK